MSNLHATASADSLIRRASELIGAGRAPAARPLIAATWSRASRSTTSPSAIVSSGSAATVHCAPDSEIGPPRQSSASRAGDTA